MTEIWKPVVGYEGSYEVSSTGRVRSLARKDSLGRILMGVERSSQKDSKGYLRMALSSGATRKHHRVHRLVASAFLNNDLNLPEINHINGIKDDNRVENLEWVTSSDNAKHAFSIGLKQRKFGEDNPMHGHKWIDHPCFGKSGADNPMYGRTGRESPRSRIVIMKDTCGTEIRRFDSITIASQETGIGASCITTVSKGKQKTAGGYIWSYAE